MIIGVLIISIVVLLVILFNRALRSSSKNCDFSLEAGIKGFKINFKTTEKNAPSDK
ncbi:hypothetical protein CDLVIII_0113 [Clostridium sp. DL-VIII]|uniref:hypothetical protein n=1 Tax=Clostridium sp. DL-VIII TaxID=641107 RepID=UPI00023AF779|nr:hypothetical protein [Clostridium sp. DL-VIII]EHI96853.1 hypothetical protein CDLVIII_0113 [Clostridium sp. DL-VIII]